MSRDIAVRVECAKCGESLIADVSVGSVARGAVHAGLIVEVSVHRCKKPKETKPKRIDQGVMPTT